MASYRCLICGEDTLFDHDCLHIDISDFSIEMELIGLSYESIAESLKYPDPPAFEPVYHESVAAPEEYAVPPPPSPAYYDSIADSGDYSVSLVSEPGLMERFFGRKPAPMFLRM